MSARRHYVCVVFLWQYDLWTRCGQWLFVWSFFVFRDVRHILFCRSRLVAPQWWSFMCGVVFVCVCGSMVGVSVSVCVRLYLFVPLSLCLSLSQLE